MTATTEILNNWKRSITEYGVTYYVATNPSENEVFSAFENARITCHEILDHLLSNSGKKAGWKEVYINDFPFPYGFEVYAHLDRTGSIYRFGVEGKGIYLEFDSFHWELLNAMDDRFWFLFTQLNDWGSFTFRENLGTGETEDEYVNKQKKRLDKSNRSQVFRFIRNFIFAKLDENLENHGIGDLGSLRISWNHDMDFPKVIDNAQSAFNILYQIDYMLWRVYYQKNR